MSERGFGGVGQAATRSLDTKEDAFLDLLMANITVLELGKCIFDGKLLVEAEKTTTGNILSNIPGINSGNQAPLSSIYH
jgi:hypothetical protein